MVHSSAITPNTSACWRIMTSRYTVLAIIALVIVLTLSGSGMHRSSAVHPSATSDKTLLPSLSSAPAALVTSTSPTTAIVTSTSPTAAIVTITSPTAAIVTSTSPTAAIVTSTSPTAAIATKSVIKELRKRLPHSILIGVMKCGTRALQTFLELHPDVVTTKDEVHYFDINYQKGINWYKRTLPYSSPSQITVERTPRYFKVPYVPERIHDMNSSIKLILVVREPIARSVSNYLQYAANHKDIPSFESMVLLSSGEINSDSKFISNSDYSLTIDEWYKWFPKEQLKVVDGNLLVTNPYLVMQDLQDYLGVRQFIGKNFFRYDDEKGFYCYYSPNYTCLNGDKGRQHPLIPSQLKIKLYNYFKPKNEIFFKKIGRRFDWKVDL